MITYSRGTVTITDRRGLEKASCSCYEIISAELDRLLSAPTPRRSIKAAVTGYGQPEDRLRSRAAGFDSHLVKPLEPHALGVEIARGIAERNRALSPGRADS